MYKRYGAMLSLCVVMALLMGILAREAILYGAARGPGRLPVDHDSYRKVVRSVLPAVVSIEAHPKAQPHLASGASGFPFGNLPGLSDELRDQLKRFPQQPRHPEGRAFGSGFIVDAKGLILTNDHVVRIADQVRVTLQDGRVFTSHDIRRDPKTDLAVVRIQSKEPLPWLEFGNSDAMEVGDRVLAVGAPLGLTGTVTSGIVSAKGRDIHMNLYEDFIQTDAAINPGNSGGPLVNLAGQVIGINSAIKSQTGGFQGIGLAISSNLARQVMEQLLKDGQVHRGYLGVGIQQLNPEVATRLGLADQNGVLVSKVEPGSPAARGGLLPGDVLTTIAGVPVKDPHVLQRTVARLAPGKPVEVAVLRDGVVRTFQVTIEEQPRTFGVAASPERSDGEPESTALPRVGLQAMDLTPARAKQFGEGHPTDGALVTAVEPGSSAEEVGLVSGSVIVKVDRQAVKNAGECRRAIQSGSLDKGVLLKVWVPRGGITYVLLRAAPVS